MVAMPKVRSPLTVDVRRRLNDEDPRWPVKAILRIVVMGFEVLAVILFAIAVRLTNTNFTNTEGPGDYTDGIALAPVVLALIADPLVLFIHLIIRRGSNFHPAIAMGLEFLISALSIAGIVLSVAGSLFWYWKPALADRDGNINCSFFFNEWSPECDPVAYTIGRTQIAANVFLFFIFTIHFVLFVYACVDLHQRRRQAQVSRADAKSVELQYGQDPEAAGARAPSSYYGSEENPIRTTIIASK